MLEWMKRHGLALIVATVMFAVMAAVMAEFLLAGESLFDAIFDDDVSARGMLWTWRIGGFVTWPVFMWLLLSPHARMTEEGHRKTMLVVIIVAALYGGGGLWLITSAWQVLDKLDESVLVLLGPFMALLMLCLPYGYTWGFAALYGFARDRLAGRSDHGWIVRSLGATVIGIYGIGTLVYLALAVVLVPVAMLLSISTGEIAEHLSLDLCAIAISTGNFASQWFAFYRIDQWFDEPALATGPAVAPAGSAGYQVTPAGVGMPASPVAGPGQVPPSGIGVPSGPGVPAGVGVPSGQMVPAGSGAQAGQVAPAGAGTRMGQAVPTGSAALSGQAVPSGVGTYTGWAVPAGTGTPSGQVAPAGTGVPTGQAAPAGVGIPTGQAAPAGAGRPTGQAMPTGAGAPYGQATQTGAWVPNDAVRQPGMPTPPHAMTPERTGMPASAMPPARQAVSQGRAASLGASSPEAPAMQGEHAPYVAGEWVSPSTRVPVTTFGLDDAAAIRGAAAQEAVAPRALQASELPNGNVLLPDGRLITPDGRVYVPQDRLWTSEPKPSEQAGSQPDGQPDADART